MFESYTDIFNQRGEAYHEAMRRCPAARDREFQLGIDSMQLREGQVICDMPSGAGYLYNYIPLSDFKLICIETSQPFYDHCLDKPEIEKHLANLDALPLESGCVDTAICMAALHHVRDRPAVFNEVRRILRPGGRFCIADVNEGSAVGDFLNIFVNRHNSMGHRGWFLNAEVLSELNDCGFTGADCRVTAFPWIFPSESAMVDYCTLMFGLDQATPEQVHEGITHYLGFKQTAEGVAMNWELAVVSANAV